MNQKHILLISRCPPYPLHLGDRLIIWHLARELSQRGYSIDLIAYAQFASDYNETHEYAAYFNKITLIDEPKRGVVQYLQRAILPQTRFPKDANGAWSSAMWDAITTHLAQNTYDLVHLFGGIQVYEFANTRQSYPAIITPYESFSLYLQRALAQGGSMSTRINHFVAQWFERWMFTPYDAVVVLTDKDKAELVRLNPRLNVQVIPNGIDPDFFVAQDVSRDPNMLLFVGNYEYPPNLDAALVLAQTIFPQVQAQMPDAHLQLVGNAPPPELQTLASESITVTGRVPDVRPYLAQAGVFVCPLRVGAGIKNKVLEALAMACPTVATPLSVDGIAVEHEASALIATIETMPQQVIRLMQNRDLAQHLGQVGQQLIETKYSWSGVADAYIALYDEYA